MNIDRVTRIGPSLARFDQSATQLRQSTSRTEPSSSRLPSSQQRIQIQRSDDILVTIPAETSSSRQSSSQQPSSSSRPILGQQRQPIPLCPELSRQSSARLRSTIVIPPTTTLSRTESSLPTFIRAKPVDYIRLPKDVKDPVTPSEPLLYFVGVVYATHSLGEV